MSDRLSFKATLEHRGKRYTLQGERRFRYGTFPGEVEIVSIDGIPTRQILPGMAEIPYTYTKKPRFNLPKNPIAATFTRKMDGTAILFSPLQLPDGEIAVFARTRGMVIIQDTKWRSLRSLLASVLDEALLSRIEQVCRQHKATLVFELWGNQNPHTVRYDIPLQLSWHTIIEGRATIKPWHLLKQLAKIHNIPLVEEVKHLKTAQITEDSIQQWGEKLVAEQELENDANLGLYHQEGVVLNIETRSRNWQWKFKPPSMTEYHRLGRVKICPITVSHSLWKLVDRTEELSLETLLEQMAQDYGQEAVTQQQDAIAHRYRLWLHQHYQQLASNLIKDF
jgi:hypothetical protein